MGLRPTHYAIVFDCMARSRVFWKRCVSMGYGYEFESRVNAVISYQPVIFDEVADNTSTPGH